MKAYKKYIRKIWDILHKMNMEGMIDRPNKYAAVKDMEISLHELEKAFEQEIKNEPAKPQ